MKIAQLKWIGLALLATGLSAGGAAVVAAVSAQNPAPASGVSVSAVASADPFQQGATGSVSTSASTTGSSKSTEERLRALEDQIDQISQVSPVLANSERTAFNSSLPPDSTTLDRLEGKMRLLLSRSDPRSTMRNARPAPKARSASTSSSGEVLGNVGTATALSATTIGAARSSSAAADRKSESRSSLEGSSTRIRELEAQLKSALLPLQNTRKLAQLNVVSQNEVELAQAQFDLTLAKLRGLDEDFAAELEGCELAVKKKRAAVDEAMAQKEHAMALVARNTRLNGRQPGMVSAEDVAQADAQLHSADAHVRVKAVELEEAELQCRKLERWRERTQKIIETSTKPQ